MLRLWGYGCTTPATTKGCATTDVFGCSYWCNRSDLDPQSKQDCHTSGAPGQTYPTQAYYLNVNQPHNINPVDWVKTALDLVGNVWWEILIWLFRGSLFVLDIAYSFTLLTKTGLSRIQAELHTISTSVFGASWVIAALLAAGIATAWAGFVRGRVTESITGLAATAALMIAGMWIVIDPAGTVGRMSNIASSAAASTMSLTTAGTVNPGAGIGQMEHNLWQTVVYQSWCRLEVGGTACDTKIPSTVTVTQRNKGQAPQTVSYPVCNQNESSVPGECTLGDLFLEWPQANDNQLTSVAAGKAPPGVRCVVNDGGIKGWLERGSWDFTNWITDGHGHQLQLGGPCYFQDQIKGKPLTTVEKQAEVAKALAPQLHKVNGGLQIQDYQQAFNRLPLLFLITIVVVSMMLLLLWLAIHVLRAAVTVVILLLMAPGALLLAGLGEGGRSATVGYGKQLAGATFAQLFYAFILAIVCFILSFEASTYVTTSHVMVAMVLMAATCVGIYSERDRLASGFSLGTHANNQGSVRGSLQTLATMFLAGRMLAGGARLATAPLRPAARLGGMAALGASRGAADLVRERGERARRNVARDQVRDENQQRLTDAEPEAYAASLHREQLENNRSLLASTRAQADQEGAALRDHQSAYANADRQRNALQDEIDRKRQALGEAKSKQHLAKQDKKVALREWKNAKKDARKNSAGATPQEKARMQARLKSARRGLDQAQYRVDTSGVAKNKLDHEIAGLRTKQSTWNDRANDSQVEVMESTDRLNTHRAEIERLEQENAYLDRLLRNPSLQQSERIVERAQTDGIEPTQGQIRDRAAMHDDNRLGQQGGNTRFWAGRAAGHTFDYWHNRHVRRNGRR